MTPTTTPAPMPKARTLGAVMVDMKRLFPADAAIVWEALRQGDEALIAQRARADALAAENADLKLERRCTEDMAQQLVDAHEAALARIAELEAVVGRCEALADRWMQYARNQTALGMAKADAGREFRDALGDTARGLLGKEG